MFAQHVTPNLALAWAVLETVVHAFAQHRDAGGLESAFVGMRRRHHDPPPRSDGKANRNVRGWRGATETGP